MKGKKQINSGALRSLGTDPELCALSVSVMQEVFAVAAALRWDWRAEINVDKPYPDNAIS